MILNLEIISSLTITKTIFFFKMWSRVEKLAKPESWKPKAEQFFQKLWSSKLELQKNSQKLEGRVLDFYLASHHFFEKFDQNIKLESQKLKAVSHSILAEKVRADSQKSPPKGWKLKVSVIFSRSKAVSQKLRLYRTYFQLWSWMSLQ